MSTTNTNISFISSGGVNLFDYRAIKRARSIFIFDNITFGNGPETEGLNPFSNIIGIIRIVD